MKITEKQTYDKSHRVKTPSWNVGDRVLIREDSLRPGSPVVLTRKRFAGPFVINHVVKGHDDVGIAYELKNESTGKITRNLVSSDRLKAYNTDREQFTKRLPKLEIASKSLKQETPTQLHGTRCFYMCLSMVPAYLNMRHSTVM